MLTISLSLSSCANKKSAQPSAIRKVVQSPSPAHDAMVDRLVKSGSVDQAAIAVKQREHGIRFQKSLAAVTYTCLDKYHRDSCLHHVIQCGKECLAILPDQKTAQLKREFASLIKERGLR